MTQEIELNHFAHQFGKLCFHRQSLRGRVQDYVISFEDKVMTDEDALDNTHDQFQQLMDKSKDKVSYVRMNDKHEVVGQEAFYFASYQSEEVKKHQSILY